MIKGLSETRRIPRVGKIRLGVKELSAKGNEYPKAVDYFVVRADDITSQLAADAFHEVYGDKPRQIDICFPSSETEHFFPQSLSMYRKGTGLWCSSDGECAKRRDDKGGWVELPCKYEECEFYKDLKCKELARLMVLLPQVPVMGAWEIDTSSVHSIINLNSGIELVKGFLNGRIAMIPLQLRIKPQEVSPEGRKKTVFVLDLVWSNMSIQQLALASRKTPLELLAPEINHDEVPDDIYPEAAPIQAYKPEPNTVRTVQAEVVHDEPKTAPIPVGVEADIQKAFGILNWTSAKQMLHRNKYKDKPQELLAFLSSQIDQTNEAETGGR